jgi:hypothetical protein
MVQWTPHTITVSREIKKSMMKASNLCWKVTLETFQQMSEIDLTKT